jgi:tricorn protease-like protein
LDLFLRAELPALAGGAPVTGLMAGVPFGCVSVRATPLVLRGHEGGVTSAAFSPDGERIITASYDRTARVWNAYGTGEPWVLRGHDDDVVSAAFSPNGKRIITASADRTLRVWNADGMGEPLILRGHEDNILAAAWSPDSQGIITGSADKTVRIWRDIAPLRGADDPKLWAATLYCMSTERRIELLGMSGNKARADQQACERRVEAAGATATKPD